MAFFGGSLHLEENTFQIVLLLSLIAVAARIYLWKDPILKLPSSKGFRIGLSVVSGALLGFVASVVGIGGGIYLVPLILLTGIGTAREAAATGAAFILINSISGLMARARFDELPLGAHAAAGSDRIRWRFGRIIFWILKMGCSNDSTSLRCHYSYSYCPFGVQNHSLIQAVSLHIGTPKRSISRVPMADVAIKLDVASF